MQKIKVLPDALASQVAAGEVVERPASVVKELVENSIDAGACRIDILVRRGGTSLIKIVDDGSGMGREDAIQCLERHATSKLRTKEDLAGIITMGFRGEALPSIASVSRFTLSTREHGALSGTEISVDGGRVLGVTDSGEAPGTQIEVRNLFSNIPARRKFLRSEQTEFSHIEEQVRIHALSHPEIAFSLTRDDRLLFHLPSGEGLQERIAGLAGAEVAEKLLSIPRRVLRGVALSGFIGEIGMNRSSRASLYTFLNRRPVESPVFTYALRGAFAEALPRGQWPVGFLFIEIEPGEVDVNVHPAKREVRFRDGISVQSALMEMLADILRGKVEPTPISHVSPPAIIVSPLPSPVTRWAPPTVQTALPLPHEPVVRIVPDGSLTTSSAKPENPMAATDVADETRKTPNFFSIISMLGKDYWLMESHEGLVVMDFKAARERILFEETRHRTAGEGAASQLLLSPVTVQLSPREFAMLQPHLKTLRRMGVGADEFGANTIAIDSLPPHFTNLGDASAMISSLLNDIRLAGERAPQRRPDDDAIAAAVARQAARLNPATTREEATRLVEDLLQCEMPYCCPEGKPTLIQISFQELARKFGKR